MISYLLTFFFCLLLLFPSPLKGASPEIIRSIEIENQLPERRPDITAIIRMKEGEEFNREKLENAINDLRKWGVFKNVEVLVKHEKGEVSLTFQLEDAFLIKDIEIHGNYPLLEKRVRRAIFLSSGDVYEKEKVPEQIERLIEFYEKEGYKNTTVFIQEQRDSLHRMITLKINIDKGKTYRIDEITIRGNTLFKDSRLKNKISRFFDYSPARLKKDLQKIEKLFRKHDHPRARAKLVEAKYNEKKNTVDLVIEIREGKEVVIEFTGNDHQFDRTLKKVMDITESGDTDEFELEHAKNQLIRHYRSLGFEEITVTVKKKALDENTILVLFHINEGPRRVIKSINFEGNASLSDRKLRKQMLTQEQSIGDRGVFLEEVFQQDLEKIESFYQQNGFIEAKVKDWKRTLIETRDKYKIRIDIEEGQKSRVERLDLEGLTLFKPEEIKKFLLVKEQTPYSPSRLEEDTRALLTFYANHAHPYVEVKTEVEEFAPEKIAIKHRILEGPEVKVGKILFVGNVLTKPPTIRKALRFKEEGPFNPQKILESQTTLRRLGIFDAITLETLGLKGKEEIIHVVIRVEEKKNKIIDLGFSYDTDTSFKGKFTFSRLNLMGWGKHLDLKLTGGIQFNRAEIAYTDPRFFGSEWQFLTNFFAQFERRPFFQDFQGGGSTALIRNLTRRLSLLMKYELIRTDFTEEKTDFSRLRPGTRDNTTGKFQFVITYDRRDNFGDPRSGFYASGRTDFGSELQGGGSLFLKAVSRFGHWWSPFRRFTIANAIRTYAIIPLDKDPIPTQELIFMGGDDTVRGFKEDALNPAGGKVGFIHNLELQLRLFKGFEGVGFLDTGSLTNTLGEISLSSFRHSAGLGLRYITPVGPLRLDYGFILDRRTGENTGRLHFTFGYFF